MCFNVHSDDQCQSHLNIQIHNYAITTNSVTIVTVILGIVVLVWVCMFCDNQLWNCVLSVFIYYPLILY